MAAQFSISDSESEPSEEVEGSETDQSPGEQEWSAPTHGRHTLILPEPRMSAGGRIRLNSESNAAIASRDDDLDSEDGVPFRGRSLSAPPALWAAQKYGRQLRRMSDEFDSLLDKGGIRRVKSAGTTGQMHHSKSWWNYLFSHQETEGENSHSHDSSSRTE